MQEERRAAARALAGWRGMVAQSLQAQVNTGDLSQRIRSLDAAWARFDKAHVR